MKCPQELVELFLPHRTKLDQLIADNEMFREIVTDYACLLEDLGHQRRAQNQPAIDDISAALLELEQDLRSAFTNSANPFDQPNN